MQQTRNNQPRAEVDRFLGVIPRTRRARLFTWLAIGTVALVLLVMWLQLRGGDEAPPYATAPVQRGNLRVTVSATGNLQPTNEVDVGSELSGIITQVLVDNNDKVEKGQVLARLDTARLNDAVVQSEAALMSAQASVGQAEATLTQTDANLRRMDEVHRLSGGKVPAATELDLARAERARAAANLRAAQAAVMQARADLSSNRTQLSKATIRSPVSGVVLARQVDPGQTVAASFNAPVLFTLAEDLAKMQLEVKVDEADVGQIREGQRATFTVDAYPGRTFDATVKRLDLGANTSTSSTSGEVVAYVAVLTADNPDLALRPGMTGTADIVATEKKNVLLVPNAALRFSPIAGSTGRRSGVTSVLIPRRPMSAGQSASVGIGRGSQQTIHVLRDDGTLQPIAVQVGDSNGSQTEVSSPELKEGMKVVTGQLAAQGASS